MRSIFQQVVINVVGCIAFLLIPILSSPDFNGAGNLFAIHPFQQEFVTHILLLAFFYLNFFLLIPKLYFPKRYLKYSTIVLLCYIGIPSIPEIIIPNDYKNSILNTIPFTFQPFRDNIYIAHVRSFLQFSLVFTLSLAIKIYNRWKQSEKERIHSELSYLKAQINPHFLFNTLNSIYSMAIDKSDYTPTAIVKLSNMMRFMITEAKYNFVELAKEIAYIRDYIDLQKVRLGETVELSYRFTIGDQEQKIAPMLLIPFIENAFKYGVNTDEKSAISIHLEVNDNELNMQVLNKKVQIYLDASAKTGVGLVNTKTRLDLMYPDKHKLIIKDTDSEFEVRLTINLI